MDRCKRRPVRLKTGHDRLRVWCRPGSSTGGTGAVKLALQPGDDGAFGLPCFVVTHRARAELVKDPTTFTFVTDGIGRAVALARGAAGDGDVVVVGGGELIEQCLVTGVVDEVRLHMAPVLLGCSSVRASSWSGPIWSRRRSRRT